MRKILAALALAIASLPALAAPPSIQLNIGPAGFNCGQFTGTYACNLIPITINGQHGYLYMRLYYNGQLNGLEFSDLNGNVTPLGYADATAVSISGNQALVELAGPDLQAVPLVSPAPHYTGAMLFTFTISNQCYTKAGRGGGKVCSNYLTLNGAEIALQ